MWERLNLCGICEKQILLKHPKFNFLLILHTACTTRHTKKALIPCAFHQLSVLFCSSYYHPHNILLLHISYQHWFRLMQVDERTIPNLFYIPQPFLLGCLPRPFVWNIALFGWILLLCVFLGFLSIKFQFECPSQYPRSSHSFYSFYMTKLVQLLLF